uniref:Uncharacterized protein n=1 Tax=Timema monikensis TaxID=170555 RepID=A0A7R9EDQ0_9NEOP|nr:unnamed protein product [Timema monikensis]
MGNESARDSGVTWWWGKAYNDESEKKKYKKTRMERKIEGKKKEGQKVNVALVDGSLVDPKAPLDKKKGRYFGLIPVGVVGNTSKHTTLPWRELSPEKKVLLHCSTYRGRQTAVMPKGRVASTSSVESRGTFPTPGLDVPRVTRQGYSTSPIFGETWRRFKKLTTR